MVRVVTDDLRWLDLANVTEPERCRQLQVTSVEASLEGVERLRLLREAYLEQPVAAIELARLSKTPLQAVTTYHLTPEMAGVIERFVTLRVLTAWATSEEQAAAVAGLDLSALTALRDVSLVIEPGFRPRDPVAFRWVSRLPALRRLSLKGMAVDEQCLAQITACTRLDRLVLSYLPEAEERRLEHALPYAYVKVTDPSRGPRGEDDDDA
jgi:hypothetical protein